MMSREIKDKENKEEGTFIAFVLLSEERWDVKKFIKDFKADWNIDLSSEEADNDTLVAYIDDMTLAVALMPVPVPDGEAEFFAEANYMWEDAVETAKAHKAHILVTVMGDDVDLLERGKLFTKAVSSCLKQQYATAVYSDRVVSQPEYYIDSAEVMNVADDALPITNWVWFGPYCTEEFSVVFTIGMKKFGKEEIEIYADKDADLNDMRDLLFDIVAYVLENDIHLQDGETIGFSEDQRLAITFSEGIAMDGMTLKIAYQG